MRVRDLDFSLPPRLLATEPRELRGQARDEARLLVMHRRSQRIEVRQFRDLLDYLSPHDLVVLNDSQTLNASIFGIVDGIGRVELQLRSNPEGNVWLTSCHPWKEPIPGARIAFQGTDAHAKVSGRHEVLRLWRIEFEVDSLPTFLAEHGRPIPSAYVTKSYANEYYNNVYAKVPGSSEMPAAGRHFTPDLLDKLRANGVEVAYITLHTGLSSVDIKEENLEDHKMYEEWFSLSAKTATLINRTKAASGIVVVVGTTVMRVLESVARETGTVEAREGWTDLYIYPGFEFKVADAFITNFHGPRSTRIALAAAFTGKELLLRAYQKSINEGLEFYEFGDATLTLPD